MSAGDLLVMLTLTHTSVVSAGDLLVMLTLTDIPPSVSRRLTCHADTDRHPIVSAGDLLVTCMRLHNLRHT